MKIRKQLYVGVSLTLLFFLGSCAQNFTSSSKENAPAALSEEILGSEWALEDKILVFDVWGCKTGSATILIVKKITFPLKACGEFGMANGRLPLSGEPGDDQTEKIGELRLKLEMDKDKGEITDVLFGVDDAFAKASLFNGVFKPLMEDLNNGKKWDTVNLHSLKQVLGETGHSNFALSPEGTTYPVANVENKAFEVSNAGGVSHVDLKMKSGNSHQWLRFSFEAPGGGQKPKFSASAQMKILDAATYENEPDIDTIKVSAALALNSINKAGGSKSLALTGMTITMYPPVNDAHDESFLRTYQTIGGPEFRFSHTEDVAATPDPVDPNDPNAGTTTP